jgi:hypothetical protein
MQLGAVLDGKAHIREHVGFALVHERGELGHAWAGLIGDVAPLLLGCRRIVLGEGGADPGGDDASLGFAGVGQGVAHEVNPGAVEELAAGQARDGAPANPRDRGDCGDDV